jgi:hypothetical protein
MPNAPAVGGSIDPIKLLNKYKWLLAAATVAGAIMGVAAHFAFLKVYPVWTPRTVFMCLPAQNDSTNGGEVQQNDPELARFMQTQSRVMTQDDVFEDVARNPELPNDAKNWSQRFMKIDASTGTERFGGRRGDEGQRAEPRDSADLADRTLDHLARAERRDRGVSAHHGQVHAEDQGAWRRARPGPDQATQ